MQTDESQGRLKVLGIIPARGGSKGVPRKNFKELCGVPLIDYTLSVASRAEALQKLVVSSDDQEILDYAKTKYSVEAVLRPSELATDSSPVITAVLHTVNMLEQAGHTFDAVALLQPTSPLREPWHIDEAVRLLQDNKQANSIISVTAMNDVHPARMYWLQEGCGLEPIQPEYEETRRQDIPPAYYRNGSIYLCRLSALRENAAIMCKPSLGYVMSPDFLLNIDEPRDWIVAEALVKARLNVT